MFSNSKTELDIDYNVRFEDFEYNKYYPLKDGVDIKGKAYSKADIVHLDLNISFNFYGVCDKCAEDFVRPFSFDINKTVVKRVENEEDSDEYIITPDGIVELDDIIREEIYLFLPFVMVCKDDCKGLCPHCGKNLNLGKCNCQKESDPRWDVLDQLLNNTEN